MCKKFKVGFGPETTANSFYQSGIKVARKLEEDSRFQCDFFAEPFSLKVLLDFDILIFIKICPPFDILKKLKDAGKILILDYQDMFLFPSVYERNSIKKIMKKIYYYHLEGSERKRFGCFNGCLIASPAAKQIVQEAGMKPLVIHRQIYNDWHQNHPKQHSEKTRNLTMIWTGIGLNIKQNSQIEPILKKICDKYDSRVIYLTDSYKNKSDFINYVHWTRETWERDLLQGDIAFRWWNNCNDQYHKDSNKILSFMAAGLPVVCRPTESDKLVMRDGATGLFADTPRAFGECLDRLILDPQARKDIGQRAFEESWSKYNLDTHVSQIKEILATFIKQTGMNHG